MNREQSSELSPSSSSSPNRGRRLSSYNSFDSTHTSSLSTSPSQSSSPSQSAASHKKRTGRKKFRETRHPIYRGVRERRNDKWVCEVREPNSQSRIWLGTHNSPEMAARAYDVAALALRGESAPLNFEDSLTTLPRAKSASSKDIQAAVAEATQCFPLPIDFTVSSLSSSAQSSRHVENVETAPKTSSKAATFLDEEALFNMPSLLSGMAEGMLLQPPQKGYISDDGGNNVDCTLWPWSE
ncbi:hypothetical protein C5167_045082 [Papaver somniferum]|uniref:AP2/ERF domain-containing protein n=1 Tax=Papaver somniferum TaxID=3469 RepID=A0A4Y7LAM6_PAPSO|nr:dehydration-responsive element-binding protein 1D-like [Papaver somniferum]RZC82296.1 hypothetical protein C5167_045082 [Papaver somniferum]